MAKSMVSRIQRRLRRLLGRRVPAGVSHLGGEGGGAVEGGGAGVREPRRPLPKGPHAAAGAAPLPEPQRTITLPDPRR